METPTFPKKVISGVSESLQIVHPVVEQLTGFLEAKSTSWRIGDDNLADIWTTLILSADKLARRSWRPTLHTPFNSKPIVKRGK